MTVRVGLLIVVLLAACTGGLSPTPTAAPTPTTSATVTASPSPTSTLTAAPTTAPPTGTTSPTFPPPSTSPTPAGLTLCAGAEEDNCPLAAGHYAVPEFVPPLAFDLTEEWTNFLTVPHLIALKGGANEYFEIASDPRDFMNDAGDFAPPVETVEDFVTWLQSRAIVQASDPVEVTVAGMPATQIDALALADGVLYTYEDATPIYGLSAGQKIRFITFMAGNDRVQIAAEAPAETFDDFWAGVSPTIDSLTLTGP